MKKRSVQNKSYPSGWRVRKRGKNAKFIITFRAPPALRPLWDNVAEPKLGEGKTLGEAERQAYESWKNRIYQSTTPMTMGGLFDRYQAEVIPEKADQTQTYNLKSMKRVRKIIDAKMPIMAFKTHMVFAYRDNVHKKVGAKSANSDLELLSHMFTKCFEWGVPLGEHPIKQKVQKISIQPRQRYVEDWEVDCLMSVANKMLKVYIPLKLATGKDKSMLLQLKLDDLREDGLRFSKRIKTAKKGGKSSLMPYLVNGESTGLKELINDVLEWRKRHLKIGSVYLFPTRDGQPYIKKNGTTSGFNTRWQEAMKKALKTTELEERFTEHDLCAKTASDVEELDHAAQLRQHTNTQTTERVYRRKPKVVIPLKRS